MKAIPFLAAILLVACGPAPQGESETPPQTPASNQSRVACATAGAEAFEPVCTVEQAARPEGKTLVLRAPDGGFRRLIVSRDGSGVAAADGAEPARVTPIGEGLIEVAIGGDRYRLPATIQAGPR